MSLSPDEQPLTWEEFRQQVDDKLAEVRPTKYGKTDRDWRQSVYDWAEENLPEKTARLVERMARNEVNKRETHAFQRANRFLRYWAKGQQPLFWNDLKALPIELDEKVRVRFDAATPEDIEDAARHLEREARHVYDEVVTLSSGLRELARAARNQGLAFIAELGDLNPLNGGVTGYEGYDDEDDEDDE